MTSVTVKGQSSPVRVGKIFCLGRNYAEHAREMHAEVLRTPVVFLKPSTAVTSSGGCVHIPSMSNDCHHEVELVVLIGKGGKKLSRQWAYEHVAGYAVGLDMTLRDVQNEAKSKGLPWTIAKGFDTSAPVSTFTPSDEIPNPHNLELSLAVNGVVRQKASTSDMIFRVDETIAYLSTIFTLEEGDLIFTGTPEGVARVVPGDRLHAELQGIAVLEVNVANG